MKTLRSGLVVEEDSYYKILEWKDANLAAFLDFCDENWFPH